MGSSNYTGRNDAVLDDDIVAFQALQPRRGRIYAELDEDGRSAI